MSGTLDGLSSQIAQLQEIHMAAPTCTKSHDTRSHSDAAVSSGDRDRGPETARRHIDQEMQRLEDAIRLLKSRRNMLAPISRLPPEMLAKIFMFCATEPFSNSINDSNPLTWIKVSHISRYWRAVALDCPSLWGSIVFSRSKWAEEMLKRSKMASLVIKADLTCTTPKMLEAVQSALLHMSRTRELQILASSGTMEKLLTDLPSSGPMLQSLSLAIPRYSRFGVDDSCSVPDVIFGGETPYLRRLDLIKCNISWNSSLLSGLTHLKVYDISSWARPTITQLISALERMPGLETLDLHESLPTVQDDSVPTIVPDHIIDLHRLSYISISASVPECANVVRRIKVPSSTTIHLHCKGTETTGHDFSSILDIFSHSQTSCINTEKTQNKPIRVLYVQNVAPVSLLVQGWTTLPTSREHPRRTSVPRIELNLSWRQYGNEKFETVMMTVCKALPLAQLRTLRLTHLGNINMETWVSIFGHLQKLHSIHIRGEYVQGFIEALREEIIVDPPAVNRPGLRRRRSVVPAATFPDLRSLTFEETNFDVGNSTSFDDLRDCLIERYERKAEVRELTLLQCSHLLEDDVEELKEVVVDVYWDGIEQGFTEDEEDEDDDYGYSLGFYDDSSPEFYYSDEDIWAF